MTTVRYSGRKWFDGCRRSERRGVPLAVALDSVGNMASADVHVRICEQEILKYDLEIKALIQVRVFHW